MNKKYYEPDGPTRLGLRSGRGECVGAQPHVSSYYILVLLLFYLSDN